MGGDRLRVGRVRRPRERQIVIVIYPFSGDRRLRRVHDHGLIADTQANAWGWVTTSSSEWVIATGRSPMISIVQRTNDTGRSPTGYVRSGRGAIMQGTY